MGRSWHDHALWARIARRTDAAENADREYLPLDPVNGALVVTGAGAAPAATALRIADGDAALGEANVVGGRVEVADQHAQPLTDVQLRAAAVPVATGLAPLTNTELRASRVPVDPGPLALEATLAALRDRVATDAALVPLLDGVEPLLTAIRDELLPLSYTAAGRLRVQPVEPRYFATFGEVSVPASTWTTVSEVTTAAEATVRGYNADLAALTNVNYRQRLVTLDTAGALLVTHHVSTTSATAVAWIPVQVTIAAGTRIAVQVFHDELSTLTFDATLNWQER